MAVSVKPRVALLFPDQYPAAAAVLGRAFVEDPLIKAIMPPLGESDERARRMGGLFDVALRSHRGIGQPVLGVIHEGKVGAAAVIEQVTQVAGLTSVFFHDLPLLPALVRAASWNGMIRALGALDTLARNRPPEPHLYLNILGVEPVLQRRHFGVAILEYLRELVALRPDLSGVYLETATEANVAYYTSAGFRVLGEIYPLGVRMWRMQQPRTTAAG